MYYFGRVPCAGDCGFTKKKQNMKHLGTRLQFPGLEIGKASLDACKTACMQDMDCKALGEIQIGMETVCYVRKHYGVFQGLGKGDITVFVVQYYILYVDIVIPVMILSLPAIQ